MILYFNLVAITLCVFPSIQVWASKWNERAYISTKKTKIDHNDLCMAVLVQEKISADYAFVIHTTNPLSGNKREIFSEVKNPCELLTMQVLLN